MARTTSPDARPESAAKERESPLLACVAAGTEFAPFRGEKALIGVSGGRDSVVLLDLLMRAGFRHLIVCHLDHELRGAASAADAAFVRALAKRHGLRCECATADVRAIAAKRRLSIETAAREARREFFQKAARKHCCRVLFLAHHADDQAETVLMNLFRGAGLSGVAGMAARSYEALEGITVLRPLLEVSRAEITAHARARGLRFREDTSNESLEHTRNRVRHELLRLAAEIFKREPGPLLARFATIARADDACLDAAARQLLSKCRLDEDGSLVIAGDLKSSPPAIASRAIALWLAEHHRYTARHRELAAAVAMLQRGGPAKINLRGGQHLRRKAGRLWVE